MRERKSERESILQPQLVPEVAFGLGLRVQGFRGSGVEDLGGEGFGV